MEGKSDKMEVGMEVEKGGKLNGKGVKMLKWSTPLIKAKEDVLNGKVVRVPRSVNPDQEDSFGLIQVSDEGTNVAEYEFTMVSLVNKEELLQVGDTVQFQVNIGEDFAVNIQPTRGNVRTYVEAMKEVEGGEFLAQGEEVEFVVATNRRSRRHECNKCCVRKPSPFIRPQLLIAKLKRMNLEVYPTRAVKKIRQPKRLQSGQGFRTA